MSRFVELERPAIWKPIRSKDISIRKYAGAYPYMKRGIMGHSDPFNPVIRYAKNYTKSKKDFAVVIFSHETDIKKVEAFMDKIVKETKVADIQKSLQTATMAHMEYVDMYLDKEQK